MCVCMHSLTERKPHAGSSGNAMASKMYCRTAYYQHANDCACHFAPWMLGLHATLQRQMKAQGAGLACKTAKADGLLEW